MIYKPHTIQVKTLESPRIDDKGHPVFEEQPWKDAGVGRCDDVSVGELTDDNGVVYRPSYHIVIEGHTDIRFGDEIRVMNGYQLRAEGKVRNVKNLNYLSFSEIWL